MNTLQFTVDIDAPKERVWEVITNSQAYQRWASAFSKNSYYEGSWEKGKKIKFLAKKDGHTDGLFCKVEENIPYYYLSLAPQGEIYNGEIDTESDEARQWENAHENYFLNEHDGVTTLTVEEEGAEIKDEMKQTFKRTWPQALATIKQLSERL